MMPILKTENITMRLGGVVALDRLNIRIDEKEIVGLVGPNGAGKTTVLDLISGMYKPSSGRILVKLSPPGKEGKERDVTGKSLGVICRIGIARTFHKPRLFQNLTVWENLNIAGYSKWKIGWALSMNRALKSAGSEDFANEKSLELLKRFELCDVKAELVTSLNSFLKKKLELAKVLATEPKILLLDEPTNGLNHQEAEELWKLVKEIKEEFHLSILISEHRLQPIQEFCQRAYLLHHGQTITQGTPAEIQANPKFMQVYDGGAEPTC